VVLGRKLADEKGLSVGDTLVLERRRLTVVGVGRLRGVGLAADGAAYLDLATHRELSGLGGRVNYLLVDAPDPPAAAARLRAALDAVEVQDRAAVTRALDELMSRAMVIWQLIIGLTLVVAGVFVASMLLRSVGERRAELATLRAIGVPARTVVALVLADALAVSLAGSLLGVALSRLLGIGLDRVIAESLGMESIYRIDATMVAQTVAIALALGALASLLPVRSALRTEPADALREG
jgi:ABC-type lipoprotein release transport system permease subunit